MNKQFTNDSRTIRAATIVLLVMAAASFVSPTIFALALSAQQGEQPLTILQMFIPAFEKAEKGAFAFIQDYWTAIPALAAGAFMARENSRRDAAITTFGITLFVTIFGSLALFLQPSDATLRAIAAEMAANMSGGSDVYQYLESLEGIYEQVTKTREVAIPIFTALAGGAVAGRVGG